MNPNERTFIAGKSGGTISLALNPNGTVATVASYMDGVRVVRFQGSLSAARKFIENYTKENLEYVASARIRMLSQLDVAEKRQRRMHSVESSSQKSSVDHNNGDLNRLAEVLTPMVAKKILAKIESNMGSRQFN